MIKRHLLLFCCYSLTLGHITAQKSDFWKDVRFGGGIGLGFGNNTFNLAVSPSAIYQVNSNFATGAGLNLNYSKFGDNKLVAYGASFINLYNAAQWLQLSGEFEQWRVNRTIDLGTTEIKDNYWSPALFLGAGIRQRNVTFGIRYDVLFDEGRSLYADPWIPFVRFYF
jgi:hypothetical protein